MILQQPGQRIFAIPGAEFGVEFRQRVSGLTAAQLILQPDATTGKDTYVRSGASAAANYGKTDYMLPSVTSKGLIQFNLSSIPASATCTSAVLYMYHYGAGAAAAWTTTIYSIAVGNAAWLEGVQNAAPGGAGDCCWNFRDQGGAGTAWAGSAGLSTSGVDYEAASIGSFSGNQSDPAGTAYSASLNTARVQGWFGPSNTNYGMLLTVGAVPSFLCTSNHATAARRPKLVIDYLY